ncbi:RNA methyltransferase [Sneathiella litorea]|uniref:TrmH family RNA methyltransferase n=1 Tax=Sneathiella litorea TaxID=2606216 RepID=A0A6L8W4F3_9PROT|nr:RNA methyltransferase [Sneathiella litorea]MZR29117.1 TrmH family RNA methyltransferase [Sneathiella litorea]
MAISRGYFGIGVEGISKPMNAGNLFRTANAFGASFVFTIGAEYSVRKARSDTSVAPKNIPWYDYDDLAGMQLPKGCKIVGVELLDEATELPSFFHPLSAAYVLGRERGSLSPEMQEKCDYFIKIPTKFCLNVATAGAIVMYDRIVTHGRFARRPAGELGTPEPLKAHVQGTPIKRRKTD